MSTSVGILGGALTAAQVASIASNVAAAQAAGLTIVPYTTGGVTYSLTIPEIAAVLQANPNLGTAIISSLNQTVMGQLNVMNNGMNKVVYAGGNLTTLIKSCVGNNQVCFTGVQIMPNLSVEVAAAGGHVALVDVTQDPTGSNCSINPTNAGVVCPLAAPAVAAAASTSSSSSNTGMMVGFGVGGAIVLILIILAIVAYRKRH